MDPRSIFLTLAMLSLLTGGVLGLMHRSLLPDVQRAATLWRRGTLMLAFTGGILAYQDLLPISIGVVMANLLLMFGITLYLHALHSFFNRRPPLYAYVWSAVAIGLLSVFALIWENFHVRVVIASLTVGTHMLVSAVLVYRRRDSDLETSGRIMSGILLVCAAVMLARGLSAPFFAGANLLVPNVMNVLAGLVGSIYPVVGTTAFLMMCSDRARLRLQRAAITDELTGLPNRRALTEFALNHWSRLKPGQSVALVLFDLDRFKSINDTLGHEAGDQALVHVAKILQSHVPANALAGRFGGEEFLCVLPVESADTALALAEHLRQQLATATMQWGPDRLQITASFGVSLMEASSDALDRALAKADSAMYRAKARGRNQALLFEQGVVD